MKVPLEELNIENLFKLKEQFSWNDHFKLVVWPRLLYWLGLKEQFLDYSTINWKLHFSPENMHNNFISMHVNDINEVFNFSFQVPLIQNLKFNLYLGNSSYHFFEIYPLLISKNVIRKDEFEIKATSTILPHLVLSSTNSKYNREILWNINETNYSLKVKNDPLINLLTDRFRKFIPAFEKIIRGEWQI